MARARLPGDYDNWSDAIKAIEKIVAEYPSHGRNDERGDWWARDNAGQRFQFVIAGSLS
jgi:hypothetical protein